MIDIVFNGAIQINNDQEKTFLEDFDKFLSTHNARFKGTIRAFEFDEAEIIEEVEEMRN